MKMGKYNGINIGIMNKWSRLIVINNNNNVNKGNNCFYRSFGSNALIDDKINNSIETIGLYRSDSFKRNPSKIIKNIREYYNLSEVLGKGSVSISIYLSLSLLIYFYSFFFKVVWNSS